MPVPFASNNNMPTMFSEAQSRSDDGLASELELAREQTDCLFRLISSETLYSRPIAERHRLIFYLGHFDAFDWNILARRSLGAQSFHPSFDALFERGIDPAPGQGPTDSPTDWPRETEVLEYRAATRRWIDEHLDEIDPWALQMAIEHRHMHAETFAYLLHNLPYELKSGPAPRSIPGRPAPANPMVDIAPGCATLGQTSGFGWDNEFRAYEAFVPSFRMSKFKVSNGEYLEFVREGGPVPQFWSLESDGCFYRGMFTHIPLPLDWPVWVTHQQASAYAEFRGLSLPGEAQFLRASSLRRPDASRDNFGYHRWTPIAIDSGADPDDRIPAQMTGNGWEWTRDPFAPFEGFAAHPFYPGYSADFFDGRHFVMKGASPRTAAVLTRPSFRNWFRDDYPHMYAGFRVVENQDRAK